MQSEGGNGSDNERLRTEGCQPKKVLFVFKVAENKNVCTWELGCSGGGCEIV